MEDDAMDAQASVEEDDGGAEVSDDAELLAARLREGSSQIKDGMSH